MSPNRKKALKYILISLSVLGPIAAWLVFGEYGLNRLHRKEMEHRAYLEDIRRLREENRALMEEANRLRNDRKYIESVVRNELHLVKPDEMVYRSEKEEDEKSEVGGRKSEVGGRQSEVRDQKSEVGGQRSEVRGQ